MDDDEEEYETVFNGFFEAQRSLEWWVLNHGSIALEAVSVR